MDKIGIVKEIDKLGRIVIPKKLRERYGISKNVEIISLKEGILLRIPQCDLTEIVCKQGNH